MKTYRKIYERSYGRIPNGWDIHHIDGNHKNNNPKNLQALPKDKHAEEHRKRWEENGDWRDYHAYRWLESQIKKPSKLMIKEKDDRSVFDNTHFYQQDAGRKGKTRKRKYIGKRHW